MATPYTINGTYQGKPFSLTSYTNIHGDSRFIKLTYGNQKIVDDHENIYSIFDDRKTCIKMYTDCLKRDFKSKEHCFEQKGQAYIAALLDACFINKK
jgi:hypothetical protein